MDSLKQSGSLPSLAYSICVRAAVPVTVMTQSTAKGIHSMIKAIRNTKCIFICVFWTAGESSVEVDAGVVCKENGREPLAPFDDAVTVVDILKDDAMVLCITSDVGEEA